VGGGGVVEEATSDRINVTRTIYSSILIGVFRYDDDG